MIRDFLIGAMLLAGSTLMLVASLGLLRFRDALCRAHALAKATTFGICLMLVALWIALEDEIAGLKLLLVIAFLFLTIPLASHLIALLAYNQRSDSGSGADAASIEEQNDCEAAANPESEE